MLGRMPITYRLLLCAALACAPVAIATRTLAADTPEVVVITACVQGGVLADASASASDTSGRGFAPRYRLAGKKALVKEIKKDHADHIDEFTGTITGDGLNESGTSMKLGKLGVRVGAAPGSPNAPYVPETPVFQVTSFRHLEGKCR